MILSCYCFHILLFEYYIIRKSLFINIFGFSQWFFMNKTSECLLWVSHWIIPSVILFKNTFFYSDFIQHTYLYVCFFPHKLFINTALCLTTVCISVLKESQREAGLLGLHFSLKECWSCKQTIRASSVRKVFETLVQLSAASKHRGIVGFPARSRLVMNWYVFLEMSLSDPGADVFAH